MGLRFHRITFISLRLSVPDGFQLSPRVSPELTFGFASLYHFLAVCMQGVIDNPFSRVDFMVIFEAQMAKPFGDGLEPGSFGLAVKGVVCIRAIDNLAEQCQDGIAIQAEMMAGIPK